MAWRIVSVTGPERLRRYYGELAIEDGDDKAKRTLTKATGCTWRAVRSWMEGQRRPRLSTAVKIEQISDGAVKVTDFYPELKR